MAEDEFWHDFLYGHSASKCKECIDRNKRLCLKCEVVDYCESEYGVHSIQWKEAPLEMDEAEFTGRDDH